MNATAKRWIWIGSLAFVGLITFFLCLESVSAGTVKAGYLGGNYQGTLQPGFHFPVNPLVSWKTVDCRQKTNPQDAVELPSRDQLTSHVDLSIQFRAVASEADTIISDTGTLADVVSVHLVPKVRSLIRNAGRSVARAEDLFNDSEVARIGAEVTEELRKFMTSKGVVIEAVLIRNIDLPAFVDAAVQKKKLRNQLAEEQEAELRRFETEQQQLIKTAQAELDAAQLEAQKVQTLADAEAYKIEALNAAVGSNPAYIQLRALETLGNMAKDPAAKLYIMDGSSMSPIPFLNVGEGIK